MAFVAGHFGEWIQGRLSPDGPVALITLACPAFGVQAERIGDGPLSVTGAQGCVDVDELAHFFEALGIPVDGAFGVVLNFPAGGGGGMSTAALIALARAAGYLGDADLGARTVAVEGASDPLGLAYPDQVLWASREGRILHPVVPPGQATILGGFWGAGTATDASDLEFADVRDLVERWQDSAGDLNMQAEIASESARRSTALRGPEGDGIADLARDLGALGYCRAHTGSARGLIFARGTVPAQGAAALREAGLRNVVTFQTGSAG